MKLLKLYPGHHLDREDNFLKTFCPKIQLFEIPMALTESGLLVITAGCFLLSMTSYKTFSRNLIFLLFLLSFLFSSSVSADVHDGQMSPLEAVVLNAMMTGSSVLNLRAHFLNRLPDLSSLAGMLTHLNLSFNDLWVSMKLVTAWCFLT